MTDNIIISCGPAATNGYIYLFEGKIIDSNNKNSKFDEFHHVTYDYAFNSLYITFNKEKSIELDLNKSIAEILIEKGKKYILPLVETELKINIFKQITNKILLNVRHFTQYNIQNEVMKIKQLINLI